MGLFVCTALLGSAQAQAVVDGETGLYGFGEEVVVAVDLELQGVVDFQWMEVDGDGAFDLLVADARGMWAFWGTGSGGIGKPVLALPFDLPVDQIAWSPGPRTPADPDFWLKSNNGEGAFHLEPYRFNGRSLERLEGMDTAFDGPVCSTGEGLVFGRNPHGQILLQTPTSTRALCQASFPLDQLGRWDVNGDGMLDVVAESEGQLAVAWGNPNGSAGAWHWLREETGWDGPVAAWADLAFAHGGSGIALTPVGREELIGWRWTETGWQREVLAAKAGTLVPHASEPYAGMALLYEKGTTRMHLRDFRNLNGPADFVAFAEFSDGRFAKLLDWDGDGDVDVVGLDPLQRKFKAMPFIGRASVQQPRWSRTVLTCLDPSAIHEMVLPIPTRSEWLAHQHMPLHIREWAVAESAQWGLGDSTTVRRQRPEADPVAAPKSDAALEPCIAVTHLVYDSPNDLPCLPLDPERRWHRLSYARRPNGETAIALDGNLRFDGVTKRQHFDHRLLHIGATVWGNWQHWAAMDIDEIQVFRSGLDAEALLAFHRDSLAIPRQHFADGLTFDGANPWRSDRWENEVLVEGAPQVVPTPWGKGLHFDGESDRAELVFDCPTDSVVVDFRFRLNQASADSALLMSLAGMFCTQFYALQGQPVEGLATSPAAWQEEEERDARGGHLVGWGSDQIRMLPSGEFLRFNGHWQPAPSGSLPDGSLRLPPWTEAGIVYGVFGKDEVVWRCSALGADWEQIGRLADEIRGMRESVSTGHLAFLWDMQSGRSGWLSARSGTFQQFEGALPTEVLAARPRPGGVEFLDRKGQWWPVETPAPDAPSRRAFAAMQPPILLLVTLFGAGLLVLGRVVGEGRSKRLAFPLVASPAFNHEELQGLLLLLECLVPFAGAHMDVEGLDDALGIGDLETMETRRSKRSRLMARINDWAEAERGKPMIGFMKDPQDRRRRLYLISAELPEVLSSIRRQLRS